MNPQDYYKRLIASKTTKELDGMSLSELMSLRGNMIGWMEAVIAESGARGVWLADVLTSGV